MEKERAFKDLLALCVKRWKVMIVGMIIGALVMGYIQYGVQMQLKNDPENSEEAIEERYQEAMDEYNASIKSMDAAIAADEKTIATTQEYIDNSLLMLIDPYNEYQTIIDIALEFDNDEVFTENYGYSTTPVDYIVAKIQNQYLLSLDIIDISKLDGLQKIHENLLPKYWNEVLKVYTRTGGLLEIQAIAPTEEESKAIANVALDFLRSKTETICKSAYEHSFILFSETTRNVIDTDLESTQNSKRNAITTAQNDIAAQEQNKAALEVPEREAGFDEEAMKAAVKQFALIGIPVGLVCAMFVVMLHAIAVRMVVTSEEITNNCGIVYLGTLSGRTYKKKRQLRKLSDFISGERVWKTKEESIEYILESLNSLMPGTKILLSSTGNIKESDIGIQALKSAAEENKKELTILMDAPHNAKFNAAAKDADVIVFVERPIKSKMNTIDVVKAGCTRMGKNNIGFILMTK